MLVNETYRHSLWMSVSDAKARGIKDGDLVKVSQSSGQQGYIIEGITVAYVTSRETPGVVHLYHGWWPEFNSEMVDMQGNGTNMCWPLSKSPMQPAPTRNSVQVVKISGGGT
jgi:anaerobic selenocysteine-containing dehydrogenase